MLTIAQAKRLRLADLRGAAEGKTNLSHSLNSLKGVV